MSQVWLIVRREFREKLSSRVFIGTNVVLLVLMLAAVVLPALLGDDGPTRLRLGTVGDEAATVAAATAEQAGRAGYEVETTPLEDRPDAVDAVEAGDVDLALVDAGQLVSEDRPDDAVVQLLEGARRTLRLDRALRDAGLSPDARAEVLQGTPLDLELLAEDAGDEPDGAAVLTGLAAVFVLYGLLIFYGQQVAQGLVQEKQSRVIEVLLATVRPIHLLGGKLLGLGLLGIAQIVLLAGTGVAALAVVGTEAVPPAAVPTIVAAALWFVAGYALYATMFALTAALVPKVEDLQSSMAIPILLLVGSLFVAQIAIADPDGAVARIGGLVPTVAPIYQPLTIALETAHPVTMGLAALGVTATTALLVPLTARVHAGAALATRTRVSVAEALRRSRR